MDSMDYQGFVEELKKIILPILEEQSLELVELNFIRASRKPILKLLVDKKYGGISLEECAELNKCIGDILDAQGIMSDRYILEVSSPGLDRPLKTKSDFLRYINRRVRFFLSESINGRTELEGVISRVDDDIVYVDIDGNIIDIPLAKINKAKQTLENI